MGRAVGVALCLVVLLTVAVPLAAGAPAPFRGGLSVDSCLTGTLVAGCGGAPGLGGGGAFRGVVASADGRNVYVFTGPGDTVAALTRDPATGRLTPVADDPVTPGNDGCVGLDTAGSGTGGCVPVANLNNVGGLAITPDGGHLYAATTFGPVVTLTRNSITGALSGVTGPNGCIASASAAPGFGCNPLRTNTVGLVSPTAIAISPDSRTVYVASAAGDDSVVALDRTPGDGRLAQVAFGSLDDAGCISAGTNACVNANTGADPNALAVSPDGGTIFVGHADGVLATYRRTTTGGIEGLLGADGSCVEGTHVTTCLDIPPILGISWIAATADRVYATGGLSDSVAAVGYSAATHLMTPLAPETTSCVALAGAGGCATGVGIDQPAWLMLAPDGSQVYTAASRSDAIAGFDRGATGLLTPFADHPATARDEACLARSDPAVDDGPQPCVLDVLLGAPRGMAIAPNGAQLYVARSDAGVSVVQRELEPACMNATLTATVGQTATVPLACSDPNGDAVTRSLGAATLGTVTIDQATGTASFTGAAVGTEAIALTASDGVLGSAAATLTVTVIAAPPPPPPPPPVVTLDSVTLEGLRWQTSRLVAGALVARGTATAATTRPITLLRPGQRRLAAGEPVCRTTKVCALPAGVWARRVPLTGLGRRLLPGVHRLRVGDVERRVTIPGPAEGVVRTAEIRAFRNGGAVTRLRGKRTQAWVVFRMAAVPKKGPVRVIWRPPGKKAPLISDKPRAATIISNILSPGGLPAGVWRVELRAGKKVVWQLSVRIG